MKKLILIALALVTIQMSAQDKKRMHDKGDRSEQMSKHTPEEIAELQTKKLTLSLDLTEEQQAQVLALNTKNAKERQAKMDARKEKQENEEAKKPTDEERLAMKNEMLDKQIATKQEMKKILNDEQYKKWEEIEKEQMEKGRRGNKKGDRRK
ncbi:hypothetical protein ACW5R3_11470 [Bizionia sp. KMM 8389]